MLTAAPEDGRRAAIQQRSHRARPRRPHPLAHQRTQCRSCICHRAGASVSPPPVEVLSSDPACRPPDALCPGPAPDTARAPRWDCRREASPQDHPHELMHQVPRGTRHAALLLRRREELLQDRLRAELPRGRSRDFTRTRCDKLRCNRRNSSSSNIPMHSRRALTRTRART